MDNNNPSADVDPLIELDPENDLAFIDNDNSSQNNLVHSNSAADFHSALSYAPLTIKNVSPSAVLFKIQTTSPINYRVKPSHGRIEAGESKEVQISMLSESKKSDKFLINVAPTIQPLDSAIDFNAQFSLVPEHLLQKYRLKCVVPSGGGSGTGLLAATTGGNGSNASISSPVAPAIQTTLAVGAGDSMSSMNSAENSPIPQVKRRESVQNAAASPSVTSTSSAISLQRELNEARAEIARLKSSKVPKEWKDVLSAQYGAPPVLVLLVAIFAFMVGLLF